MYVIIETKSTEHHGSFHVGYYKPNGDFYTEESFDYIESEVSGVKNKIEHRRYARELCSELNGGR